jgi:acyl-CoA reductase-like NAD-dependent aldehyde dehydrogenase
MLKPTYPLYLANQPVQTNQWMEVTEKFTGQVATRVAMADKAMIDRAIAAAAAAAVPMRKLRGYQRQEILHHCVQRFTQRFEELAVALCIEAGKPIKDARGEVTRLIDTFRCAAEEAVRTPFAGEVMPLDISARAAAYQGMWKRVPIGPCSFITPFNFPLNLAAHKVAPAIAAGCPFILKPAPLTPIGGIILGEVLAECATLPKGAFSVLPCANEDAAPLVEDDRIKLLSFTGSRAVGWMLKSQAGRKKVTLELGGNAACIVDADANIADAVERCVIGGFYQSGQSCISVQRLMVHESIYDQFRAAFVAKVKVLKSGDPRKEDTFIGPMISEREAARLESWVSQAKAGGGKVLCGGTRQGLIHEATVMEDAPAEAKVSCEEAFGPLVVLSRFSDFDEALRRVNDSRYGLQAGIFTRDIFKAYRAWDELEVGGVVINDVPSWRVDHMPYGGVKDSGLGREGVKFAIEDMSEVRLMVLRTEAP